MAKSDLNPRSTRFQNFIMGVMLPPIRRGGTTYVPGVNEYFDAVKGGKIIYGTVFFRIVTQYPHQPQPPPQVLPVTNA